MASDRTNRWITLLLVTLGKISQRFSMRGRQRLGAFIGDFLRLLNARRVRITLENLSHAFPESTSEWREDICRKSYQNLGITLAELLAFPALSETDIRRMVRFEHIELITDRLSAGKGVIILSAHYGNWEMPAFAMPLFLDMPVSVIVKAQQNRYADEILNSYRALWGNRLIPMHQAAREIVKLLTSGKPVALLADQSATEDKDVFVPLFGRLAATYEAPAALSLRFHAPIVMGFAVRESDGTYCVRFQEIPSEDLPNTKEGVLELTRRHVLALEEQVRSRPELWVWQHRRWKHQPKNLQQVPR